MRGTMSSVIRKRWNGILKACLLTCIIVQVPTSYAIDPDRCSARDLEQMGDQAAQHLNDQIAQLQKQIAEARQREGQAAEAFYAAKGEFDRAQAALDKARAEWDNVNFGPKYRAVMDAIDLKNHALSRRDARLRELSAIQDLIKDLRAQLERLRELLRNVVSGFSNLIGNEHNHSRRTLYETACRLKRADDPSDVPSILNPIRNPPNSWRRLLPNSGYEDRAGQATEYYNRSRSRWGSCWNAIAALGGAIISFWPSDSAQAGDFNDAPVNYPIRRGPYMPGGGADGAPICPPEAPAACPPSPYTCPEEPPAKPTVVASPTREPSPSPISTRSSQSIVE
jgi:hypothetical protein